MAVTESTKHQLSLGLTTGLGLVDLLTDSSLLSTSPLELLFTFLTGLFSFSFPINARTCSRSALEVVFISPKGRDNSASNQV